MQQFELILRNEKVKLYNRIAWIFLALNFAFFIVLLFSEVYRYPALAFIAALAVYLGMRRFLYRKGRASALLDEFVFFIPAAGWLGMHSYFMGVGCLLMGILFRLSVQKITFVFGRGFVSKTNFPKKDFTWEAFTNVMLKDGLLTLDFKNNRLMQAPVENEVSEQQFNAFAGEQLAKATANHS